MGSVAPTITIHTEELAAVPPFMAHGGEMDPFNSFQTTDLQGDFIFQRLDDVWPRCFQRHPARS
jgi:hypothetical protein